MLLRWGGVCGVGRAGMQVMERVYSTDRGVRSPLQKQMSGLSATL